MVVRRIEGLVVIARCHQSCFCYRFYSDLCGETFNSEDDLENHFNTKHPNQWLVVIALSHRVTSSATAVDSGFSAALKCKTCRPEREIVTLVIP